MEDVHENVAVSTSGLIVCKLLQTLEEEHWWSWQRLFFLSVYQNWTESPLAFHVNL